ncbi:hypothetical protein [Microvirga sp. CF3016]|uniref:hypothetical protein n=1 Tax=Microvirga sp. CF3016 TaxID=3110181 RepID=UPI002E759F74|nr:hypothetical protein [Microvirga sp. CF3016]MEE1611131.1 hypothetical protein [Microvirga sp. CF3016]
MTAKTNASIQADNARLRQIMSNRRVFGLEVAAARLALDAPSLSASEVVEAIASAAKANSFNRTTGLSESVDKLVEGAR